MKSKVIIADDHQMFLDGLRSLLASNYEIIGEATDGDQLVELALERTPDLIVSDITMPSMGGLEAMKQLKAKGITAKFVLVTMHTEAEYAAEALDAGASGYLLKTSASSELNRAIESVLKGEVYLSPRLAGEVLSLTRSLRRVDELTVRHRQILRGLAAGLVAKEIGSRLDLSPRTVEYHKYQMMKKLGLRTSADLIHFAVTEGIVD